MTLGHLNTYWITGRYKIRHDFVNVYFVLFDLEYIFYSQILSYMIAKSRENPSLLES